jgi:hypothetical protein
MNTLCRPLRGSILFEHVPGTSVPGYSLYRPLSGTGDIESVLRFATLLGVPGGAFCSGCVPGTCFGACRAIVSQRLRRFVNGQPWGSFKTCGFSIATCRVPTPRFSIFYPNGCADKVHCRYNSPDSRTGKTSARSLTPARQLKKTLPR